MADQKQLTLRKRQQSTYNPKQEYIIKLSDKLLILKKGMSFAEVEKLLGKPFSEQECKSPNNKKLIFKPEDYSRSLCTYMVLFIKEELSLVIKQKPKI